MKLRASMLPLAALAVALALSIPSARAVAKGAATPVQPPFWTGKPDAPSFAKQEDERLDRAKADIAKMLAVKGPRTVANTLRPFDDASIELDAAGATSGLLEQVHPDSSTAIRATTSSARCATTGCRVSTATTRRARRSRSCARSWSRWARRSRRTSATTSGS